MLVAWHHKPYRFTIMTDAYLANTMATNTSKLCHNCLYSHLAQYYGNELPFVVCYVQ